MADSSKVTWVIEMRLPVRSDSQARASGPIEAGAHHDRQEHAAGGCRYIELLHEKGHEISRIDSRPSSRGAHHQHKRRENYLAVFEAQKISVDVGFEEISFARGFFRGRRLIVDQEQRQSHGQD